MPEIAKDVEVTIEAVSHRTLTADGSTDLSFTIVCPTRGVAVPLSDCAKCSKLRSYREDRAKGVATIMCRPAPAAKKRGLSLERSPERGRQLQAELRDASEQPISTLLSKGGAASVTVDVGTESLCSLLLERDLAGLPVVDGAGKPIGFVTKGDLLRFELDRQNGESWTPTSTDRARDEELDEDMLRAETSSEATAGEIMNPVVYWLDAAAPISRAAALMAFERIEHVVVTAEDGSVAGVVSSQDILRWLADSCGYVLP